MPSQLWDGASVFAVSSEGPPHSVTLYGKQGVPRTYSFPDPHGDTFVGERFYFLYFFCSFSLQGAELHALYIIFISCRKMSTTQNGPSNVTTLTQALCHKKKTRCGTIKIPIGLKSHRRLVWAEIMMPGKNKHSFFEHVCVTILTSVLNIRQGPEEQLWLHAHVFLYD